MNTLKLQPAWKQLLPWAVNQKNKLPGSIVDIHIEDDYTFKTIPHITCK